MQTDKNTISYKLGYYLLGPLFTLAIAAASVRILVWAISGQ